MPFDFELNMGGSHVQFRKKEQSSPLTSNQEKEENRIKFNLTEGITALRKIKTRSLAEETNSEEQQRLLSVSFNLSQQMADYIYLYRRGRLNSEEHPFSIKLKQMLEEYKEQDWETGHMRTFAAIPQFSAQNLVNATDDMLIRTEETVGSLDNPSHKLNQEEALGVLKEFLLGTNGMHPVNTRNKIFSPEAKHGGVLSGGLVYLLLAQRVLQDYAEPSLRFHPFAIAVDKARIKGIVQTSPTDQDIKLVYVLDDMIDKGGTIATAAQIAGEHFQNADIESELGINYAKTRQEKAKTKIMEPLTMLFQDYIDQADAGNVDKANNIFVQAEQYAKENGVELTRGWFIRKAKIEKNKYK